jgi:hypothetical protein
MKLTKVRLQKLMRHNGNQTRKKYKYDKKIFHHTNTMRRKKPFNLRNNTLRQW